MVFVKQSPLLGVPLSDARLIRVWPQERLSSVLAFFACASAFLKAPFLVTAHHIEDDQWPMNRDADGTQGQALVLLAPSD
jgi:hypothetical protein